MLQLPWKKLAQLLERIHYFFRWWFFSAVVHLCLLLLLFSLQTGVTVHTVHMRTEDMRDRPIVVVPFVSAAHKKKNDANKTARGGTVHQGTKGVKKKAACSKTTIKEQKVVAKPDLKGGKKESKVAKKVEKKPEVKKAAALEQKKAPEHKAIDQKTVTQTNEVEPLYVGQSELEQYEIETIVHQAVADNWCKPVGLGSGVTCKVRVTIDAAGHVVDIQDEQPSGVLMFDQAVYMALEHTQFPQRIAGKTVSIIFS